MWISRVSCMPHGKQQVFNNSNTSKNIMDRTLTIDPVFYLSGEDCVQDCHIHYGDVIMDAIASQITSITIVYSTVHSDANKRNIKVLRHWPLCREFTGDRWIPRTDASNAENVSIWWRHHGYGFGACRFYPHPLGLLHQPSGHHTIARVPVK